MDNDRTMPRQRPIKGTPDAGCYFLGSLIAGGASIIGGIMGNQAAGDAADLNAAATREALDFQREVHQQNRADLAPFREVGQRAIGTLEEEIDPLTRQFTTEDFEAAPGFEFRQGQGEQAINRAAAARGGFSSPSTVKDLLRFNQGLASDEFGNSFNRFQVGQGNRFNRLAALSGIGQTAVNTGVGSGMNFANQSGNIAQLGGQLAADNRLTGANALIGGITGGISSGIDQFNINRLLGGGRGF